MFGSFLLFPSLYLLSIRSPALLCSILLSALLRSLLFALSLRFLFGRLLRLHGPRYLFALFSTACFACTGLVILSLSFRTSWAFLGHFLPLLGLSWPLLGALGPLLAALGLLLGRSWALLGGSWEALGSSWPLLGRSWNDIKKSSKNRCQK